MIECLRRAGVAQVFAYPGGTSLLIHQALVGSGIRVILPRHEQGGAFEAAGFARRTGKPGVCIATSGPGATNLLTGIADAWMDSTPIVAITAQVNQRIIGKNAFQETDIVGMTRPIVKHSFLVFTPEEIPETIMDAFALAFSGRPGPVVVDIPCDVLASVAEPTYPSEPNLRALCFPPEVTDTQLDTFVKALKTSRRPCIYAGGGVIHSGASEELLKFAESWRIPVATSLMGIGAFPTEHPLSLRWLGMHGAFGANKAVEECDLLVGIGVRFSERVTGDVAGFAPHAKIVHIDIDDSEINKNKRADIALVGDVKEILLRVLERRPYYRGRDQWLAQVNFWKSQHPFIIPKTVAAKLHGQAVVKVLDELTDGKATVVTGVGQNQMWAAQFYSYSRSRQFITSGGLGAMGFGLPAAIGVQLARPDELVLLIDGDGSFQMNIQELATLYAEHLPVKMVILNNQRLGMVAQLEDKFCNGVHGNTDLEVPAAHGQYPNFITIAKGYNIPGRSISSAKELRSAISEMLETPGPFLLNCLIDREDEAMPMIPPGKHCGDTLF
ncbi:MAG: biosynthetic-type acetolactate synthase large subunit [Victivallales bacterium]|nr:biosynthetic-type acetolactate synthase large subunit [Victivallales bacterium]